MPEMCERNALFCPLNRPFPLLTSVAHGLYTVPSPSTSLVHRDEQCDSSSEYCAAFFPTTSQETNEGIARRSPNPTISHLDIHNLKKSRSTARRSLPSSVPSTKVTKRGVLQMTNAANGALVGYVSKSALNGAQFRYQAISEACGVQIEMENSNTPGYPLLGFVQGRDNTNVDLASGSFQYVLITPSSSVGNAYTSASNIMRASESDVWSINIVTGDVTAQWINSDSSAPQTMFFSQGSALYAGGDMNSFISKYPSPVIAYTLKFVEI
ncbi:hypothetical protein BDQ17DRAFT_1367883 [Cyathus striatus]|nr:hypothetical protein BDQ17DRAFT_1367883 [Cyathus striatus]